jgi:Ca2+-binding EF-hand superfamily protein
MKKIRRTEKKIKNLTIEEINEITEAFNLFDKDGSKTIDVNELRDALKVLGINMNLSHTKELMEKADKDGSGTIELNEFKALMAEKIEARNPKEELRKAFMMYDEDDNKMIDLENLEAVTKELGAHVPQDELRAMIQFADTKGNGTVDLEDFMRVMRQGQLYDDTEKLEEDMEI